MNNDKVYLCQIVWNYIFNHKEYKAWKQLIRENTVIPIVKILESNGPAKFKEVNNNYEIIAINYNEHIVIYKFGKTINDDEFLLADNCQNMMMINKLNLKHI